MKQPIKVVIPGTVFGSSTRITELFVYFGELPPESYEGRFPIREFVALLVYHSMLIDLPSVAQWYRDTFTETTPKPFSVYIGASRAIYPDDFPYLRAPLRLEA